MLASNALVQTLNQVLFAREFARTMALFTRPMDLEARRLINPGGPGFGDWRAMGAALMSIAGTVSMRGLYVQPQRGKFGNYRYH